MNCSKCRELLVAHMEGLLPGKREQDAASHLQACAACRAEAESLSGLRGRLVEYARSLSGRRLDVQIMDRILREPLITQRRLTMIRKDRISSRLSLRRWAKPIPIAAAALVLVLIGVAAILQLIGIDRLPTFIQLAEASELAAARVDSLHYRGRSLNQQGHMEDIELFIKNPYFIRTEYRDGSYTIMHIDKMCHYESRENVFTISTIDLKETMAELGLKSELAATSSFTKGWMTYAWKNTKGAPEIDLEIEETIFNGTPAYKVDVSQATGHDLRIHFDKVSGLMLRGEQEMDAGVTHVELVEVNPKLDDSLFSAKPPEGAKVVDHEEIVIGK